MTSHNLFRLGRVCVGLAALAVPVPLIVCALDGRAGVSALVPIVPMTAALVLLGAHGTNAADCDGCMAEVIDKLAAAPLPYISADDQDQIVDLNQAA